MIRGHVCRVPVAVIVGRIRHHSFIWNNHVGFYSYIICLNFHFKIAISKYASKLSRDWLFIYYFNHSLSCCFLKKYKNYQFSLFPLCFSTLSNFPNSEILWKHGNSVRNMVWEKHREREIVSKE